MRRGYSSSDRRVSDLRPPCSCVCHNGQRTNVGHLPGRCFCLCSCPRDSRHRRLTHDGCLIHGKDS